MNLMYLTLIFVYILCFLMEFSKRRVTNLNGVVSYSYRREWIILFSSLLIVIAGFRYRFADTTDYRMMYITVGHTWKSFQSALNMELKNVEKGYLLYTFLLNQIDTNSQTLFILSSIIIIGCSVYTISKYSEDIAFSLILYFLLSFINAMNGMRQLLAASIALLATKWIYNGKTVKYLMLILFLSTIHRSVLILAVVYFIAKGKYFNCGIKALGFISLLFLFVPNGITAIFESLLSDTKYSSYLDNWPGMNIMRFLVNAVPILLMLISKPRCDDNKIVTRFVNLCIISFCFEIMAVRNLFFGRIPMYFSAYSVIMIPRVIRQCFGGRNTRVMNILAIVLYTVYFIVQVKAYGGMDNFKLIFQV